MYITLIFWYKCFKTLLGRIHFIFELAHCHENAKCYKFMTSYNIRPLRGKSSLGGFKMHHDKFISESPSVSYKVRVVTLNAEMQTLINCKNCLLEEKHFPEYKEQASCIYCRRRYIRTQREEKEDWKGTEKRLMSVSSPRLLSFFHLLISYFFLQDLMHKNAFTYAKFFKYHSMKWSRLHMSVNLSNGQSTALNTE